MEAFSVVNKARFQVKRPAELNAAVWDVMVDIYPSCSAFLAMECVTIIPKVGALKSLGSDILCCVFGERQEEKRVGKKQTKFGSCKAVPCTAWYEHSSRMVPVKGLSRGGILGVSVNVTIRA